MASSWLLIRHKGRRIELETERFDVRVAMVSESIVDSWVRKVEE